MSRLALLRFLQYSLAALFALAVYLFVVRDETVAGAVVGAIAVVAGVVVQLRIFAEEERRRRD